jgi:hypothetical protein
MNRGKAEAEASAKADAALATATAALAKAELVSTQALKAYRSGKIFKERDT